MGLKETIIRRIHKSKRLQEFKRQADIDEDFFDMSVKRTLPLFGRATESLVSSGDIEPHWFDLAAVSLALAELDAKLRIEQAKLPEGEMEKRIAMMRSLRNMSFVRFSGMIPEDEQERLRDPQTHEDYVMQATRAAEVIFDARVTRNDVLERRMKHALPAPFIMLKYYRTGKTA